MSVKQGMSCKSRTLLFSFLALLVVGGQRTWAFVGIGVFETRDIVANVGETIRFEGKSRGDGYFAVFHAAGGDLVRVWQSGQLPAGEYAIPFEGITLDQPGEHDFLLVLSRDAISWEPAYVPRGLTLGATRQPPGPVDGSVVNQRVTVSVRRAAPPVGATVAPVVVHESAPSGVDNVGPNSVALAAGGEAWVSTTRPVYRIGEVVTIVIDARQPASYALWLDAPGESPRVLTKVAVNAREAQIVRARAIPSPGIHRLWLAPIAAEAGSRGLELLPEAMGTHTFLIEGGRDD